MLTVDALLISGLGGGVKSPSSPAFPLAGGCEIELSKDPIDPNEGRVSKFPKLLIEKRAPDSPGIELMCITPLLKIAG
jgi:hypothetical protein